MNDIRKYLQKTQQYKDIKRDVQNALSHSYMLISNDKILVENYSIILSSLIMCNNGNCGECKTCKKITLGSHPDLYFLPQGESVLVDDIKFLIDNSLLVPMEADKKVFIIKEFSTANASAQNKLLKILEEPPQNVNIILLVDNENNVLPTISSRCRKVYIKRLEQDIISEIMSQHTTKPKAQIIAEVCQGNITQAFNNLEDSDYFKYCDSILWVLKRLKSSAEVLPLCAKIAEYKKDISQVLEIFETFFQDILKIRLGKENLIVNKSKKDDLLELSEKFSPTAIDLIIKRIYLNKKQLKANCNPISVIDNLLMYILEVKRL